MPTIVAAGLSALGIIIVGMLTYLGVKYTQNQGRLATVDTDSTQWERRYRANAEVHMQWDFMMRGRVERVEKMMGIEEPIDPPPPLFPTDLTTK